MASPSSSTLKDIKKVIKEKEKKSHENREKIYKLNDEVAEISNKLKEKRSSEKSVRVAKSRLETHYTVLAVDRTKRPSDRYQDVRTYSKMDKDVWQDDTLRAWFNSYAPQEEDKYDFRPSQTGYTIRID